MQYNSNEHGPELVEIYSNGGTLVLEKKFNVLQLKLRKTQNLYVDASIIGLEMQRFMLV